MWVTVPALPGGWLEGCDGSRVRPRFHSNRTNDPEQSQVILILLPSDDLLDSINLRRSV
jgi:hypothetical protein